MTTLSWRPYFGRESPAVINNFRSTKINTEGVDECFHKRLAKRLMFTPGRQRAGAFEEPAE